MVDGLGLRGILVKSNIVPIPICPNLPIKVAIVIENERFVRVSRFDDRLSSAYLAPSIA